MSKSKLVVFLCLVLSLLLQLPEATAQSVFAIIACPTAQRGGQEDELTNSAGKLSFELLSRTLDPLGENLKKIVLTGVNYDRRKLLDAISRCPAEPNDSIFVYVMGHGSFDPENRWTIVIDNSLAGGDRVTRGELTRALRSRKVRLGVLITESCAGISNAPDTIASVRRIISPRVVTAYGDQPDSQCVKLERLFSGESGTVDLAASSVTQYASFDSAGPFFLRGVCATLESSVGNNSWAQLFASARGMVREATDGEQIPVAISLPTNTSSNKASLGVSAKAYNGRVYLTRILPDSPASRVGLRVDDIVHSINLGPIRTTGELLEAVKKSPRIAELVVIRGTRQLTFRVRLSR